jgi:hypothetical protein
MQWQRATATCTAEIIQPMGMCKDNLHKAEAKNQCLYIYVVSARHRSRVQVGVQLGTPDLEHADGRLLKL